MKMFLVLSLLLGSTTAAFGQNGLSPCIKALSTQYLNALEDDHSTWNMRSVLLHGTEEPSTEKKILAIEDQMNTYIHSKEEKAENVSADKSMSFLLMFLHVQDLLQIAETINGNTDEDARFTACYALADSSIKTGKFLGWTAKPHSKIQCINLPNNASQEDLVKVFRIQSEKLDAVGKVLREKQANPTQ
jgi:hypothetical protein